MDELEISGKRYISTRVAAKEHKYHSDYIGQLIRSGKVAGQKVGRSWYVAADSLAEYLSNEGGPKPKVPVKEVLKVIAKVKASEPVAEVVEEKEVVEDVQEIVEEASIVEEVVEEERPVILKTVLEETPISIRKPEIEKEIPAIKTKTSLRYIADEGPLFPREHHPVPQIKIRPMQVETPEEVVEETVYVEEEPVTIIERPRVQKNNVSMIRGAAIIVVGVFTIGVVALASSFIVSTTTIEGDTASVSYTIGGM